MNSTTTGKSFGLVFETDYRRAGPAVGQYEVNCARGGAGNAKQVLFGTAGRFARVGATPGVGDYEVGRPLRTDSDRKGTFSYGERFAVKNNVPGPGEYSIPDTFGKTLIARRSSSV
jgi:hypothetical protein